MFRRIKPRRALATWRRLFKIVFLVVFAWFAHQYYDSAMYSFMAVVPPLQLGEITTLRPDAIPHNAYVCVRGISEHRGVTQHVARVLGQRAQPYWIFRLLGSRGVFVEVPPDPSKFGTTQSMLICGRALDPQRSPMYGQLITAYARLFHTEVQPPTRIVQDGMQPGTHRSTYALALLGLAVMTLAQGYALIVPPLTHRSWRLRRHHDNQV